MKVYLDQKEVLSLSEIQREVLCYECNRDNFEDDIAQRLRWIVEHKYKEVFDAMKDEWVPKLKNRYESIPESDVLLTQLIISQEDYKCRKKRDSDELRVTSE